MIAQYQIGDIAYSSLSECHLLVEGIDEDRDEYCIRCLNDDTVFQFPMWEMESSPYISKAA